MRASDTVARIGGDEFGLILWNLGEADAGHQGAGPGSRHHRRDRRLEGRMLSVGASIGFAMLGPADEPADVLAEADHAMYARKAARKAAE